MARRSRGSRNKTRKLLRRDVRAKKLTITDRLKTFDVGEKAVVKIESSSQRGVPHPRYYGVLGRVVEKRGKCYVVQIKDKGKEKKLIAAPEHLKKV